MFAAKEFSAIAKIGMVVIVYANNPLYGTERRSPYGVRGKSIDLFRDWKSKSAPIASWNELTWPIVDRAVQ
jgi:hypothetical protein